MVSDKIIHKAFRIYKTQKIIQNILEKKIIFTITQTIHWL